MWRAQAGINVPIGGNGDDDDWETDPDFVVRDCSVFFLQDGPDSSDHVLAFVDSA